jgi:hypothetical protein
MKKRVMKEISSTFKKKKVGKCMSSHQMSTRTTVKLTAAKTVLPAE